MIVSEKTLPLATPKILSLEKIQINLVFCLLNRIFADEFASGRFVYDILILGLTGFDGEMRWYVSTRRLEGSLHNLSSQKINWQQ